MNLSTLVLLLAISVFSNTEETFLDDICGYINDQKIYLDYGETGILEAKYNNNIVNKVPIRNHQTQKRCTVEFVSCPSCIVTIRFRSLNLPNNCGTPSMFDNCGCDHVYIYEPTFEQSSEQFCGRFIQNNASSLEYHSKTRNLIVAFLYNKNYNHAFTLDYFSERNKVFLRGSPTVRNVNNATQIISTPFFPDSYPADLTMEHIIKCEARDICRISLIFSDFLISESSIIDFFDWNGERLYVTTGTTVRPPIITTSGPSLTVRFYANGASGLGFKAQYNFILGSFNDVDYQPNIDCGGLVSNLGGAITMMNMVKDGSKSFDCVWLIKPPISYFHMKTHLYVKVSAISDFVAGNPELNIRQGLTSNGPLLQNLKLSLSHLYMTNEREHVVPISEGFYIQLKGIFSPTSSLALIYAAFNYKNCLAGSDFLCHNLRCVSALLNCDGFDHCGDNSDEYAINCSQDPRDRRQWSKTPHFYFPKINNFADVTTSSLVFLLCSFALMGLAFASVIFLYKFNVKSRHHRNIQNHIETIHAILEEGAGEVEEEIIIPDDPPDYEAPPNYDDAVQKPKRCSKCRIKNPSKSCETTVLTIPDSPPPVYQEKANTSVNSNLPSNDASTSKQLRFFTKTTAKPCICHSFIRGARHLICRSQSRSVKYLSDSELTHLTTVEEEAIPISEFFEFRKSFTTDDVNLFI